MQKFLSCDWGTSSFRLRLVQTPELQIVAEETSEKGIASTYKNWQETGKTDAQERILFYLSVIQEHLLALEKRVSEPLTNLPLLISGMASSTIGMLNLPYQMLPFSVDGSGLTTHILPATPDFNHEIILISGVQSENDVMRGEETQLIGCISEETATEEEAIFIFPGTHSKHILVKNKQVTAFRTYMTGEFFNLLAHKSILSDSVKGKSNISSDLAGFTEGVRAAIGNNLLHTSFLVRTNNLFDILDKSENFNYLSGLLIGTELQDLIKADAFRIYLYCGTGLKIYYETALQVLGLSEKASMFPAQWVDEAVIRGQYKIYNQIKRNA